MKSQKRFAATWYQNVERQIKNQLNESQTKQFISTVRMWTVHYSLKSKCFHIIQRTITNSNWMNENTWHSICVMPIVHALSFVTSASLDILFFRVWREGEGVRVWIHSISYTVHFICSEHFCVQHKRAASSKILSNSTNQSHESRKMCVELKNNNNIK